MDLKGMLDLRLVVLCMITLANGVINITFEYSECKGEIVSVTDRGLHYDNMNSTCNCIITSNSTGKLHFRFYECRNKIDILNSNGTEIKFHCYGGQIDVQQRQQIFVIHKNADSYMAHSGNMNQNMSIFSSPIVKGLFSVTCGSALGSTKSSLYSFLDSNRGNTKDTAEGTHTKFAIKNGSNATKDISTHHLNPLKPEFQCAINITFEYSGCKGEIVSVTDRGLHYDNITSTCNCSITSNYTGKLHFLFHKCMNKTDILNSNGTVIEFYCYGGHIDVQQGEQIFIILKNADSSLVHSRNMKQKISIFAHSKVKGLFSVTCGLVLGNTKSSLYSFLDSNIGPTKDTADGTHTQFPIRNGSNVTNDTSDNHLNTIKAGFPYMYVVAAGSIVIVVVLVVFVVVCIRRNRDRSKQQLSENPLDQVYRENDNVGCSACGNENQGSTEQLPDNPLYHSYQVNDDKENSKSEKDISVHLPSQGEMENHHSTSENVSDNNAVYAQPNKIGKVSNADQDKSTDGQNETVYAQVSKPKK